MALSSGILLFRWGDGRCHVLLVHPGGPLWRRRWEGWWQIPKGLVDHDEDALAAARREFLEETGQDACGPAIALGEIRQAGGKRVIAFACEGEFDVAALRSNSFEMEWPPRSGRLARFPEIDAARWFEIDRAVEVMLSSQRPLIDRLAQCLLHDPQGRPDPQTA